jgi:hypothetical protein
VEEVVAEIENLPEFMPGQDLSRRFYLEAVRPVLDTYFPDLPHAAAMIGPGSDVLGFDTAMSMDHDWFPKMVIFVRQQDEGLETAIRDMLAQHLPHVFLGFPVDAYELPQEPGTSVMSW